jgi:hypothetical protein
MRRLYGMLVILASVISLQSNSSATGEFNWEGVFGADFEYQVAMNGGDICPAPAPGECVYHRSVPTISCVQGNPGCLEQTSFTIGSKQTLYISVDLNGSPETLINHTTYLEVYPGEYPAACEHLKAICFNMDYQHLTEVTWMLSVPAVFTVSEEITEAEVPVIIDFRGPAGQQTTLTTYYDGHFATPDDDNIYGGIPLAEQKNVCAVNFIGANVTAIGLKVVDVPGHGICADGTDLKFQKMAAIGNGCDGMVINSDWTTVENSEFMGNACNGVTVNGDNNTLDGVDSSYNTFDGVELNGSNNTVQDSLILNNGEKGVENNEGALNNVIKDSTVAGNAGGNIFDATNTLILDNVSETCPPRYIQDGIYCRLRCPYELLDYLGTCVQECPDGFFPDEIGICRNVDMGIAGKGKAIGKKGKPAEGSGGCSLVIP